MFNWRKIMIPLLALALLAFAASILADQAPASCTVAYRETSAGNDSISASMTNPEPRQLRDLMGREAASLAEAVEFLTRSHCD